MKPNKGFITVLMMVLISISLSTFSRAAFDTFSDVPNDSPFHESIFYLAERGIVCGEGNGRYVPDAPVTVRQWATMLCRALGDADPLNYDDDCIRQGYSDGWLEMTAITAPDSDLCRYAIYKSGFAAFGVDLYSLQLYPNEGKLSQQSEVLRAAADFGLCEDTCDGTEIITRGEAAELLYALLTKTFAVVPPPMLDNIPLDNKAGVALNNYLLEIQKIPESMMQSFAEKDWRYVIDFDYLAKLSKEYDLGCTGVTIYEGRKIIVSSAESTIHEFGHFLDGMMGFPSRTKGFYQRESASAASLLRTYALTDAQEYFADCFVLSPLFYYPTYRHNIRSDFSCVPIPTALQRFLLKFLHLLHLLSAGNSWQYIRSYLKHVLELIRNAHHEQMPSHPASLLWILVQDVLTHSGELQFAVEYGGSFLTLE